MSQWSLFPGEVESRKRRRRRRRIADRNAESFSLERNWEDGEGFS